ncbi:hypothetical protein ABK040_000529 [Willaertia magna]
MKLLNNKVTSSLFNGQHQHQLRKQLSVIHKLLLTNKKKNNNFKFTVINNNNSNLNSYNKQFHINLFNYQENKDNNNINNIYNNTKNTNVVEFNKENNSELNKELFINEKDQQEYNNVKEKLYSWQNDLLDFRSGIILFFGSVICWFIYKKYFKKEFEITLLKNKDFIVNDNLLQKELEFILLDLSNNKFSEDLLNEVVLQNILQCFCKIDNEQISILSTKIIQKLLSENFNERTINYLYEFTTRNDQFLNLLLLQKNLQNEKNYLYNQFFLYLDGKKSSSTTITNLEMLQYRMFDLYTFYFSNPIIIKNILNDYKNNNYKFNYINYLFEKVNDFKTDKYDRLFYLTCLQQLYLSLQQLDKNDTTIINEFNKQYDKITKNGKELQWLQFMEYPLQQSTVENQNNNNNNKLLPHLFYLSFFALYFSNLYKKRNVKSAVLKTSLISYYYAYRLNSDKIWNEDLKSIDKNTTLTNKEYAKKWKMSNDTRFLIDSFHDIMTIVTCGFIPFLLIHFTVGKNQIIPISSLLQNNNGNRNN